MVFPFSLALLTRPRLIRPLEQRDSIQRDKAGRVRGGPAHDPRGRCLPQQGLLVL